MIFDVKHAPAWLKVNGADLAVETGHEWVCLFVMHGREFQVVSALRRADIPFFIPLRFRTKSAQSKSAKVRAGRSAEIVPVWPGYVFCRVQNREWTKLSEFRDVRDVLRTPFQAKLIASLLSQRDGADFEAPPPHVFALVPDQTFAISSGPFEGYQAKVLGVRPGRDLLLEIGPKGSSIIVKAPAAALSSNRSDDKFIKMADLSFEEERVAAATVPTDPMELDAATRESVVVSLTEINAALIAYFTRHPEKMFELSPRKFEELIAEIFRDMGAEVQLTPAVKDGGRDILAHLNLPFAKLLTIVECKKYSPGNPVGLDIVERFMYTIDRRDNASFGLVVTTSNFTEGAIEVERKYPGRLGLRDFQNIASWLSSYGTWSLGEERGIWLPNKPPALVV